MKTKHIDKVVREAELTCNELDYEGKERLAKLLGKLIYVIRYLRE